MQKLFEIRLWNNFPHIMRQMADQKLINQINRPENIMDDQQDYGMVIIPAYHYGIKTEYKV
jgi:hypothetical protein